MKNLDTVDVEKLEKLSFLVNNHGLAVVLVLLISIIKYLSQVKLKSMVA